MRRLVSILLVATTFVACGDDTDAKTTTTAAETTTTSVSDPVDEISALTPLAFSATEAVERFNFVGLGSGELTTAERTPGVFGNEIVPGTNAYAVAPSTADLLRSMVVEFTPVDGQYKVDTAPIISVLYASAQISAAQAGAIANDQIFPKIESGSFYGSKSFEITDGVVAWMKGSNTQILIYTQASDQDQLDIGSLLP